MKRYLIFASQPNRDHTGGWNDLYADAASTSEAYKLLINCGDEFEWSQIVDSRTDRILFDSREG